MRKPTRRSREWHRIHAYQLDKRKYKQRGKSKARQRTRRNRYVVPGRGAFDRIPCPANLSLEDNFEDVNKLIDDIRERSRRNRNERTYIDFKQIHRVTPSGALVIAAELDRWKHLPWHQHRSMSALDLNQWDPNVRRLLKEMGFFELLGMSPPPSEAPPSAERYVKFRSGATVDGEVIDNLRKLDLAPYISVPNRNLLFSAVTEAMTNVKHHAYDDHDISIGGPKYWWLSAAYDTQKKELIVMIYDQGQGIPGTLPKTRGEELRTLLPEYLSADDARLIEAAHRLSRSKTDEWYRGSGLHRDIRRYIEEFEGRGTYSIISGRGEYTVAAGPDGRATRRSFGRSLKGTFIQCWNCHENRSGQYDFNRRRLLTIPGGRFREDGNSSGTAFREDFLVPALRATDVAIVRVCFDEVAGFGSSFLEEAFGGLIREEVFAKDFLDVHLELVTNEPDLKDFVQLARRYIEIAADRMASR